MASSIPLPVVDNIILFMRPSEYKNINSRYNQIAIEWATKIIRKHVGNWCRLYSEKMNNTLFETPKIYYKMFYPMKYRSGFIDEVFDLLVEDMERYIYVSKVLNNSSGLVSDFNKIIDVLTPEELFHIGW